MLSNAFYVRLPKIKVYSIKKQIVAWGYWLVELTVEILLLIETYFNCGSGYITITFVKNYQTIWA